MGRREVEGRGGGERCREEEERRRREERVRRERRGEREEGRGERRERDRHIGWSKTHNHPDRVRIPPTVYFF